MEKRKMKPSFVHPDKQFAPYCNLFGIDFEIWISVLFLKR